MDESAILKNDAELVRKLICCVWDGAAPDDLDLSLYSCLGFYSRMQAAESAQDDSTHTHTQHGPVTDATPAQPSPPVSGAASAAAFKRKVHERLAIYRKNNGVGSFHPLADACGDDVSTDTLSRMLVGEKFPVEMWRTVNKALDALDAKQKV